MSIILNQKHKECNPDEYYIGNFSENGFKDTRWKTKRFGRVALNFKTGKIMTPLQCGGLKPVFVKISEMETLGITVKHVIKPGATQ